MQRREEATRHKEKTDEIHSQVQDSMGVVRVCDLFIVLAVDFIYFLLSYLLYLSSFYLIYKHA